MFLKASSLVLIAPQSVLLLTNPDCDCRDTGDRTAVGVPHGLAPKAVS
jgi:hypothetical protein